MQIHKKLLQLLSGKLQEDVIALIKKTGKLLAIQAIAVLLLFLNNYLIVRYAGAHNYGTYVSIMTWISFFSVLSIFGMDDWLTALLPKYTHNPDDPTPIGMLRWSFKIISLVFPISGLLFYAAVHSGVIESVGSSTFWLVLGLVYGTTIMSLLVCFLLITNRLIISQVLDKLFRALIAILALVIISFVSYRLDVTKLLSIQLISVLSVAVLSIFVIRKNQRKPTQQATPAAFNKRLQPNFYFLVISLLNVLAVRLDLLMLTGSAPPQEIGYYNIAVRFADLIHYPVTVLNLMVPPLLSKMWHNAQKDEQYRIIRLTSGIGFIATGSILIVLSLFGSMVLSWFGGNFTDSYPVILIIGASHLLSALLGPMNILFMVGGKEKVALVCLGVQVAVTAVAAYFFIPAFRGYGAAISLVIGNVTYMITISLFFYKMEKVVITAFYIFGRGSK
ncbi:lipopolysaccharide biosynthesis protein [Paracnuella aquatica]|uniref:lipopolysaccharide biosynthesis protein n=1 Tax=Paracnuella aquatica TaxID=2268757 RepID=UPI000DEF4AB5|nr:oligosaccharide flippase family protein [Paracnuella aquatica]RPD51456.1 hypothetical protein DRJ53_01890 [Paracnuella aquatica]